jgi:hypothetical protein
LRYAVQQWKPAPRFVLLVGLASYDPKGYLAEKGAIRIKGEAYVGVHSGLHRFHPTQILIRADGPYTEIMKKYEAYEEVRSI